MAKKKAEIGEGKSVEVLPTPLEFLVEAPLYKKYQLHSTVADSNWVDSIEFMEGPLDVYCIYCNDRSLFRNELPSSYVYRGLADRYFSVKLVCGRNTSHQYRFMVKVEQRTIEKFGQYPSVADISIPQLVRYKGILGNERYREFTRAIGLAAHGVGIGSFVYMRRILESLIEDAHQEAKVSTGWDEDAYARSRVVDRILLLKAHLPEFMVKNRLVYGILSKGIHELTEDECKRYFRPLKSAIELILNEHLVMQFHRKNIEEAEKELAAIHEELAQE